MKQTIRWVTDEEHCDGIVGSVGYTSKGKESTTNEFLAPEELQKHQDEQAQPLLTAAIQSIHKALLDAPQKGGKRLLRVDLRFEPVMPRVATLLKEKGWCPVWEAIWTQGEPNDRPSCKTHIRLNLTPRIDDTDPTYR